MLNWDVNSNGVFKSEYDYAYNFCYVVNHTLGADKPWFARKMQHGVQSIECNTFDTKEDALGWCDDDYAKLVTT